MAHKNSDLKEGLIKFLTISGDLIALNLLWVVCSIPILTIGPATNALFDSCLQIVNDDSTKILSRFFITFKKNFKQSFIVGLFCLFVLFTIVADINYILSIDGVLQKIYIVIAIVVFVFLLTIIPYMNCLISKYENSLKDHFINTLKLAFVNPIETILLWLILIFPILVVLFVKPIIILYLGGLILIFLFSLPTYLCSIIVFNVFKKIEKNRGK